MSREFDADHVVGELEAKLNLEEPENFRQEGESLESIAERLHIPNPELNLNVFQDGNALCFTLPNFKNLQESPAVFITKDTPVDEVFVDRLNLIYNILKNDK